MRFAELTALLTLIQLYQQVGGRRILCPAHQASRLPMLLGSWALPVEKHRWGGWWLVAETRSCALPASNPSPQLAPRRPAPSPLVAQFTFRLLPAQIPLKTKVLITQGPIEGVHVTVHRR